MTQRKITSASIADNAITVEKLSTSAVPTPTTVSDQANTSTGYFDVPAGTTAQRPVSPATGMLRFNTTIGKLEQYDGTDWSAIDAPPIVSSITPSSEIATDDPQSITISGSNFSTTIIVKVIGNSGTEYTPTTVTRNSSSEIVITFAGNDRLSGTNEPYDVMVVNSSGLSSVLENALNINDIPTWVTSSGSLGSIYEGSAVSTLVVASDPESTGITYAIVSGALPSGVALNTSTGSITGTMPSISTDTTYNFSISASDGSNTAQTRAFSLTNLNDYTIGYINLGFNNNLTNSGEAGSSGNASGANYSFVTSPVKFGTHSVDLNGSNAYLNIPQFTSNTTVFSIAFWIYWDQHNPSGRSYLYDTRVQEGSMYWLIDSNNTMTVYLNSGSESGFSWTPAANTWEHYCLVSTGSASYIYRNGSLAVTLSTTYPCNLSANGTGRLGTYYGAAGGSGNYFTNAKFDNYILSQTAFNSSQVSTLYNSTRNF